MDSAAKATSRARGQTVVARALWYVKPGIAELRPERIEAPQKGVARVETRFSLMSRGTERLVAGGLVPESEWQTMRAPLQTGDFPFPVKYGYSAAGVVTAGNSALQGKTVFALHPHQDIFQVAEANLTLVPAGIPARRAVLAANMETALNAHWDAGTGPGDKVLVVGAGVVGLLIAHLARRIAGTEVIITDVVSDRAGIANALGIEFVTGGSAPGGNHIVFHTSATASGLATAIDRAGFEGRIVELSWYGQDAVNVHLGGAFHSRRLRLISSQVGHVAPSRRGTVSPRERLALAMSLLNDCALDALVGEEIAFANVPARLPQILSDSGGLAPVIHYSET